MRQWRDVQETLIVYAVRSGRPGAFDRLLDRYERRIYNLALSMLRDRHEAEDATQETFLAVYRGLGAFRAGSSLDTWIHRVGVNVCLQRRRRIPDELSLAHDGEYIGDGQTDRPQDPLLEVLRSELNVQLTDAVDQLPDPQRTVVLLHGMQGFTYTEIAAILECPVGTVKSRLNAAFTQLRRALAGYVLTETTPHQSSASSPVSEAAS